MYESYRCEVCGEVHFGAQKPLECPFCGASGELVGSVDMDELDPFGSEDEEKGFIGSFLSEFVEDTHEEKTIESYRRFLEEIDLGRGNTRENNIFGSKKKYVSG